ncbi:MAG: ribosome recycling factor [Candidatus Omnitrophica bacterium]|nr:ribosome recycling factor [Candidatus Omnitrophota bacterium]
MVDALESKKTLEETKKKMAKSAEATKKEFHNLRTGRASIGLVEGIQVDYYNTPTPIKSLANISTPDAKTILIQPWDVSAVGEIEKGILKSGLGLTPLNDGKVVRIQIPSLTDERRVELSKIVKKVAEEGRVSVRNARHEALEVIKKLEKSKTVSEDDSRTLQKEIQKFTDSFIADIEQLLQLKEQEIHTI